MSSFKKKILFFFLQALTTLKGSFFWLKSKTIVISSKINIFLKSNFGFRLYRISLFIKKDMFGVNKGGKGYLLVLVGKRGVFQLVLLTVALIISLPHTKVYTRPPNKIPEKESLIYKLAGEGDTGIQIEEVSDIVADREYETGRSWYEGAVTSNLSQKDGTPEYNIDNLTYTGIGGNALVKPTIISGNLTSGNSGVENTNRTETLVYIVNAGDTISTIAGRYGLGISTLLWANSLTARSLIRPGDTLKIPPTNGVIHTIKKGDNIYKIAKLYSAEADKIIEFNHLEEDGSDLIIGEDLIVPDGVKPVPQVKYVAPVKQYTAFNNLTPPPPSIDTPAGSGYVWPTAAKIITSYYGFRRDGFHPALDIAGPVGTAIYASRAGTVTVAAHPNANGRCAWNYGYGCYVVIDHANGTKTAYGHVSIVYVNVGDYVNQGQTIAGIGSTGNSSGPHLHFEVHVNGQRLNPLKYITR